MTVSLSIKYFIKMRPSSSKEESLFKQFARLSIPWSDIPEQLLSIKNISISPLKFTM